MRSRGGRLALASEPGKGTRAELYLPVTSLTLEQTLPAEPAEDIQPAHHARILLVDDDILIAMSTVDMLEDLGHHVIEANSGASALEALQSNGGVDLMITDFAMPGMNGAQLAAAARKLKPDLPIILATGYAELPKGESIDLPRLGKPYSQRELAREIDRLNNPDVRVARSLASLFNPVLYPGVGEVLRITQQELAYLVGLSRQRVNEALSALEAQGAIRVEYGGLRVLDLAALRSSVTAP